MQEHPRHIDIWYLNIFIIIIMFMVCFCMLRTVVIQQAWRSLRKEIRVQDISTKLTTSILFIKLSPYPNMTSAVR